MSPDTSFTASPDSEDDPAASRWIDRRVLEDPWDKTLAIKQGMMQQLLAGAVRLPIPEDGLGGESHDA